MPNEFKIRNGLVVEGGSTIITGSLIVAGGITGSFSGSVVGAFPFTGSANITGSLGVIGPSTFSGSVGIADNLTLSTGGFIYGDTTTPYIRLNNTLGSQLAYGPTNYIDVGGPTTIVNANVNIIRFRSNRIVATQNTIIGTSNIEEVPTARLQVRGSGATSATTALLVQNSNTSASLVVLDNGNVGINTGSAAFNLDVNGTARIGASTSGNRLNVFGTDNEDILTVNWGGSNNIGFGSNTANNPILRLGVIRLIAHPGGSRLNLSGAQGRLGAGDGELKLYGTISGTSTGTMVWLGSNADFSAAGLNPTSGILNVVGVLQSSGTNYSAWNPSSGSATFNVFNINPTLNTSGTYSGIVRGILYNPILTSITGVTHRAIETTSGDVLFQSGSSPLFFVSGSGNVGVGTSTPTTRLDVVGSSGANYGAITLRSSSSVNIDFSFQNAGYSLPMWTIRAVGAADGTTNSFTIQRMGSTFPFTITNAENVGIGTTLPTQKLDVSGSIRVRSGFGYTSDFSGGVLGISILNVDGSDNVVIGSTYAPKNVILTSGIRYDFVSTGLGINVTSPSARLHVRGAGTTSATTALRVENSNASASLVVLDNGFVGINTGSAQFNLDVNGTGRFVSSVSIGGVSLNLNSQAGGTISSTNSAGNNNGPFITLSGPVFLNPTAGNTGMLSITGEYRGSSGTATFNHLNLAPTINNTGTYSGIVRGINYSPTLITVSGTIHRAIETMTGDVIFGTLSGSVGIGTTNPLFRLDVSGSGRFTDNLTVTGSVIATTGFTGSLLGTASFATQTLSSSFVNTLNQNVLITGTAAIGTGSLGPNENTITLGARDAINEGGQIGFNAPGGTYTSASFIDNWQNKVRILKGNNTTSTGLIAQWDIHTTQMQLPGYTAASSFPGTATANLAVDSGGNVITVSTSGGTVFPYTGNAVITGSLTATTGFIAPNTNGAMYLRGGDDVELWDINISNHLGVYGQQDATIASIKLGSGGGIISGRNNNIGIGTTTPNSTLDVSGSAIISGSLTVTNGITGSLLGTASFATSASQAISASFVPNTFVQNGNSFGAQAVLGTNDNQNLAFETNGVVRMFISSSGRVGIGTTGPSQSLQVNGAIMTRTADPVFIMEDTSNVDNNAFYMGAFFDTGFPISYGSIAINRNPATGIFRNTSRAASQINFESNNNYGSIRFYTTATNNVTPDLAVTVTPQRNMLIAPAAAGDEALARLHVRGSGTTSATNTLLVQNSTPTNILTVRDDGQTSINGNTAITGSFTVITGSNVELQVLNTGVRLGNVIGDAHTVTGSFSISGSFSVSGSSTFNGTVRINNQTGGTPTEQGTSAGVVSSYWGTEDGKFLSTPSTWLTINLGGTNYFIPAYV